MNFFKLDKGYYSHPEYPLENHLSHAAASFDDPGHKETAWFHDAGKLTREFQTYIQSEGKGPSTTHALESALVFLESKKYELNPKTFAAFYAILKHHADLEDTEDYFYRGFGDPDDVEDRCPDLDRRLETICQRMGGRKIPDIETVCDLIGQDGLIDDNNLKGLHNYFLIKERFSRLIFSDKYEAIFKEPYVEDTVIHWDEYEKNLKDLIASKANKMSEMRNQARQEILDTYFKNKNKQIYFIEAPTGIGKTFSAFHLALTICRDKNKKRVITALPMTSIIDQTHEEYSKVTGSSELLKFHHLTKPKNYGSSENKYFSNQENDFLAMSWSSDKIIVTTFNQLFNLFYSRKNRDLIKFWTLRESVIILDEIQAVPRILLRDIAQTISFLSSRFNINFIIMSATLPEISRFIPQGQAASLLSSKYFSMEFNNRYAIRMAPDINDFDSLVSAAKQLFQDNLSLLCVVNSKKLSLDIFSELKNDSEYEKRSDEFFFLNTNFIPRHRARIIRDVKNRLENNKKTLMVSTQVVEAGVDLDFDYGIREFAPLYSMIQTAGRINRENREGKNQTARLIITDTIAFCPYHPKDLLKAEVEALLKTETYENKLLPLLKEYFGIAIDRTPKDYLVLPDMEYLNFETVFKNFSDHFMKTIPSIVPVFVEIEQGLHHDFSKELDEIHEKLKISNLSLSKRMELRSKLKDKLKEISQYTINVSETETDGLQDFHSLVSIKVCPHNLVGDRDKSKYSSSLGWLGEETLNLIF